MCTLFCHSTAGRAKLADCSGWCLPPGSEPQEPRQRLACAPEREGGLPCPEETGRDCLIQEFLIVWDHGRKDTNQWC
jgi:hypothetical protein